MQTHALLLTTDHSFKTFLFKFYEKGTSIMQYKVIQILSIQEKIFAKRLNKHKPYKFLQRLRDQCSSCIRKVFVMQFYRVRKTPFVN